MKATRQILGAAALMVIVGLAETPAHAQDPDMRSIPPNVMLLLDSSGSMEYLQHEHMVPRCKNDPLLDDPVYSVTVGGITKEMPNKTRWMMAMDALLGPISDESFHCEFTVPDGHIIPHFIPKGDRDVSWGVLERYRELIRFGFATFDSFESYDEDEDGMWSYGPIAAGRNVGIKREQSVLDLEDIGGSLIPFGSDDASYEFVNNMIRLELEQTIPYCGSPVAGALDDLEHFYNQHPDNIAFAMGGNDHFAACRQKFTILITDGRPNTGEGTWYGTSPMEAADLWSLSLNEAASPYDNAPLFVIGFSICPEGTTDGDELRLMLDEIAHAGCPPEQSRCPDGALYADDTYELMAALDSLLEVAIQNASSRTLAVTTNLVGDNAGDGVVQYQYNTSFEVLQGRPWKGILERTSYVCDTSFGEPELSMNPSEYVDYGNKLDNRTTNRRIYAGYDGPDVDVTPDQKIVFETTTPEITPAVLGQPGQDALWKNEIVNFIHGRPGTPRDPTLGEHRLADVFHASATILEPPLQDLPLVSYYQYQIDYEDRVPVIFLATTDGVTHAFRVQDTGDDAQQAEELWGYIPGIILDKIHRQYPDTHDWNLDSTPIVRDVRPFKDDDGVTTDEEWKALLVGGLRQGGRGYFALDVTEPDNQPEYPKFMWEIDENTVGFEDLGLTYATPFIGTAFTTEPDESSHPLGEVAIVIFPGGMDPVDRNHSTSLYVVSAETGTLIKKLDPEFPPTLGCPVTPDCEAHPECCAQMVSNPVGFGALPGVVTTRVFVGDDRGRLWRADLAEQDPADWHLTLFYPDPSPLTGDPTPTYLTAEPVENPVGLAMSPDGQLVVLFGTGNVDDLPGMAQNYLFSLTEEYHWDSTNSLYLGKARFNWQINFEPGEKLLGQPIVFDENAYFSTFMPYTDAEDFCVMGEGRIWGVDYKSKDPNADGDESDFAQLDSDGSETTADDNVLYLSFDNTLISGLTIVQRPSCMEVDMGTGVDFGMGQREVFELVAQVSGPGGSTEGHPSRQTNTINLRIPTPSFRNFADSWGALIE
ncbi:MAG: hypothetical protein JRG91_00575 [Deltaproteobacteria bacterium]|nr:hypothetical protein [Deltaproteobacteria bacterium]